MNFLENQLDLLINSISNQDKDKAIKRMKEATKDCEELLLWIDFLKNLFPKCYASELLEGSRASMLESVAYIGLGLGRAAIGAMRSQIDLMLSFTYFYDHPREWEVVKVSGNGFMLKSDIEKYHGTNRKNFKKYLSMIDNSEKRSLSELYRILSAHIHGQSPKTTPKAGKFNELLSSSAFLDSLQILQRQVSICLSNYLTAVFICDGINPPFSIGIRIKGQLTVDQRKKVFFDN